MEQANTAGIERKALIFNVQKYSCTDCGACVDACPVGIHVLSKETGKHMIRRDIDCTGCRKCKASCPQSAIEITGEMKTISELLKLVEEDSAFYETSGGGVTLGGGECTSQPEAAKSLLMACKEQGINTAIETCGHLKTEKLLQIAEYVDLFLYDIKHMDPVRHNELTGISNDLILFNLNELLRRRYNVKVRMPMLKGINDSKEEIDQIIKFLLPYRESRNFKGIDLLPYHKMGVNKYNQLDKPYPIEGDPSLDAEDLDRIWGWIKEYDFPVNVVRH